MKNGQLLWMSSSGVVMATDEANVLELKEMYLSQVLLWTPRLRAALLEMEVVDQRQLDNIMVSYLGNKALYREINA